MALHWYDVDQNELEAVFNPRVASSNVDAGLVRFANNARKARASLAITCTVSPDLAYGPGHLQTLDLYQPLAVRQTPAPLVLFIHGGYWRGLDKHDHSFVVPPLIDSGAVVANVNYDLCPDITLDTMSTQIVTAVRFCHQRAASWGADPARLVLIGHSAGAHLAARALNEPADLDGSPADLIAAVAAISGIYEPEVVLHLSVNQQAQISDYQARRNDCLVRPPLGSARLAVWAGSDEPGAWIDQSVLYAGVARDAGLSCTQFELTDTDHFTVLERSFEADSMGWRTICELLAEPGQAD